ncbi:PhoH family protein [Desulfohalobium retbaense]|uniref:PhoH family protein n=1 Tax=Desulfohalobium retbaense (strain ATCC 49708 / DSM 5692 / JCM 16813 / HR100) TaxID=485915 RepID=C8X1A1_DESRD|nr:PhoH family protein [Desulfohalobium retbaense]ACV68198.1 PhoH family protein [Desulfohalobium retbaense DSM 5692]
MLHKNYVLDTNVLLENPKSIRAFRNGTENTIILPYTVLEELDKLKRDQRLAHLVSQAVGEIEADVNLDILPPFRTGAAGSGDDSILQEIRHSNIVDPILVTNDRILQIKARMYGIHCESYRDSLPFQSESQAYTGFVGAGVEPIFNSFRWEEGFPVFYGHNGQKRVDYQHQAWGVRPRSVYQNLALELFLHPQIPLISVQSEAGYGKTYLALASALDLVLKTKDNPYRKIYLSKPLIEIGSKMGFLPGDVEEKMAPYIRYIHDLLAKLHELRPANRIFTEQNKEALELNPKRFEILPLTYIRGMNLEGAVVIVDEMQNLSRTEARSLLTRMGEGVKCFCLGDTRQVDNPYLNESNNGLNWLVKKCKGMRGYAHIVLKGEHSRGPVTDMVLQSGL